MKFIVRRRPAHLSLASGSAPSLRGLRRYQRPVWAPFNHFEAGVRFQRHGDRGACRPDPRRCLTRRRSRRTHRPATPSSVRSATTRSRRLRTSVRLSCTPTRSSVTATAHHSQRAVEVVRHGVASARASSNPASTMPDQYATGFSPLRAERIEVLAEQSFRITTRRRGQTELSELRQDQIQNLRRRYFERRASGRNSRADRASCTQRPAGCLHRPRTTPSRDGRSVR